jgi:hypothetical protein
LVSKGRFSKQLSTKGHPKNGPQFVGMVDWLFLQIIESNRISEIREDFLGKFNCLKMKPEKRKILINIQKQKSKRYTNACF